MTDPSRACSAQAPLGAFSPSPAVSAFDRWRLPCDDGKLLVLRSTDSAEQAGGGGEEMTAYWRAQARKQLERSRDANTTLLMGSVRSEASRASAPQPTDTLRPEELKSDVDLGQRVDRLQLESCQAEIQGFKKKLVLLEEFNTELCHLKAKAESEAVGLEEQIMRLQIENKKLQDASARQSAQLRDLRSLRGGESQQLQSLEVQMQEQMSAAAEQLADATSRWTGCGLSSCILSLWERLWGLDDFVAELAGLREERDTLKEDLHIALSAAGPPDARNRASRRTEEGPLDRAAALEADLEMAEKMLRACEKENESLAQQNRQLRQGARLQREEVDGRQLQLVSELNAAKAEANPASMRRLTDLERELQTTKERAEEHARELAPWQSASGAGRRGGSWSGR
ncbi:unnamed protein product [Effrenium voratum]|uniref:Uncharacterized protein n=1 Tax=Effrenium voratum TaxID=2562239 RepID=A0AA36ML24_9DINO|nr:unnamed protein product [Effrenium voratum]